MENNFDNIIESILSNSVVWLTGTYGTGKTSILNQIKEFFIKKNYEVKFCYVEPNDTLNSLFNRITAPIIHTNKNNQNFELHLNRLLEITSENQKKGFVVIIDELENWFRRKDHNQIDAIGRFIQFLAEFAFIHKNVITIISSVDIPIGKNFDFLNRIKEKIHGIWLSS